MSTRRQQEIFETCGRHLIKQGKRSVVESACKYVTHDEEGNEVNCAAAPLLNLDVLKNQPNFAVLNGNVFKTLVESPIADKIIKSAYHNLDDEELKLVQTIQKIHDENPAKLEGEELVKMWKHQLAAIGWSFDLRTYWLFE